MQSKRMAVFIGIGFEVVALLVLAVFLGKYLDQNWGFGGLGVPLGVISALVLWIVHLVVLIRQFNEGDKNER